MNRINKFNFINNICPKVLKEINNFKKNIPNIPLFINANLFIINNLITMKSKYVPMIKIGLLLTHTLQHHILLKL